MTVPPWDTGRIWDLQRQGAFPDIDTTPPPKGFGAVVPRRQKGIKRAVLAEQHLPDQAPPGALWLCIDCGSTARNRIPGNAPDCPPDWAPACFQASRLVCDDATLKREPGGVATEGTWVHTYDVIP